MNYKEKYSKEYWLESIYELNNELSKEEKDLIKKAYFFAEKAHNGQKRKSGAPYFVHLVATAKNLAELGMDGVVISAGLLHDSIEDGVSTEEELKKEFGDEIAFLVNGVTKLGHYQYRGMKRHNESLRKLFVYTSKDIRVLIIKFADRIHNMETLEHVREDKRKRIATETLEIYAQLAYRLGITAFSKKLGDLAFPYVYPEEYEKIKKILKERSKDNIKNLEQISRSIVKKLAASGIKNFKITHRVKSLLALHKKLKRKENDPEKIYDLIAMRIIVPTIEDCYKTLGIVHQNFRPMPGRIKDYIAFPKPNGYRSIHTTIFTGQGGLLEIQIRTERMHYEAEYGIASHFRYKAETVGIDGVGKSGNDWIFNFISLFKKEGSKKDVRDQKIDWVNELAEYSESENTDNNDFEKNLKVDFFSDRIFIFTPKGEVVDLPIGSTPVDFAYQIHTNLGNTIVAARINGNYKSLDTELKNGDIVEIISKEGESPNKKWLEFVKTSLAKRRIQAYFNNKTG